MWRTMERTDIPAVTSVSDAVHGRFSERADIYAERLALYPAGCFVLERDGALAGYCIGHPWRRFSPVPLDRPIGALPDRPDSYYLHDLALLPAARGTGASAQALDLVLAEAASAGLGEVSLVAVNGADAFWRRCGFHPAGDADIARKLASYGPGTVYMTRLLDAGAGAAGKDREQERA